MSWEIKALQWSFRGMGGKLGRKNKPPSIQSPQGDQIHIQCCIDNKRFTKDREWWFMLHWSVNDDAYKPKTLQSGCSSYDLMLSVD